VFPERAQPGSLGSASRIEPHDSRSVDDMTGTFVHRPDDRIWVE
jgi:hypothetical protein